MYLFQTVQQSIILINIALKMYQNNYIFLDVIKYKDYNNYHFEQPDHGKSIFSVIID